MRRDVFTEEWLDGVNKKRVGGDGVGRKPTVSPVRRTSESLERPSSPPQMGKVGGGVVVQALQGPRPGGLLNVSAIERPKRHVGRDNSSPVSSPAPPPQKREYDSKWEETYASELVLRKHAGLIKAYWYHPFSMWLPGKVRYTPDFMIHIETQVGPNSAQLWMDEFQIIEVKGWSKNLRDGMTRLRIAAAIFPCFTWTLVKKRKGGGWDEEDMSR